MTPAGWRTTTLAGIADIVSGATPKTTVPEYWDGDIPWATPKDLSELDAQTISATPRTLSDAGLQSSAATLLPANSVLLSSRAPIGYVAINTVPMATNQGFKSLVPDPAAVDSKFLYWWLRRKRPLLESLGNGATFKEISKKVTERVEIDLPPLDEQRRIAALLDAADALRAKRRQALAKLDSLRRSLFVEMFGGGGRPPVVAKDVESEHPRGWRWTPILEVARMGTGHTPDRNVPSYWDGDISWVNLNEIRSLDGTWCSETELKVTQAGVSNSSAVVHPRGTVCFSRTASIGFVTVMAEPMTTSQDFVTWTCGDDLDPSYLMHALLVSRDVLRYGSSGSTHKTIYVRDAERFSVLLPPMDLQRCFVERIEQANRVGDRMAGQADPLDGLFGSVQQRALRGEL